MMGADKAADKRQLVGSKYRPDANTLFHPARILGDGKSIDIQNAQQLALQTQNKKSPSRHREPRRHTLQNGIDYNMVKHISIQGFPIKYCNDTILMRGSVGNPKYHCYRQYKMYQSPLPSNFR